MIWCVWILFITGCLLGIWSIYLSNEACRWRADAEIENGKVRRQADTIKRLSEELETHKRQLGLDALKAQYGIEALQKVIYQAQGSINEIRSRFNTAPDEDPDD